MSEELIQSLKKTLVAGYSSAEAHLLCGAAGVEKPFMHSMQKERWATMEEANGNPVSLPDIVWQAKCAAKLLEQDGPFDTNTLLAMCGMTQIISLLSNYKLSFIPDPPDTSDSMDEYKKDVLDMASTVYENLEREGVSLRKMARDASRCAAAIEEELDGSYWVSHDSCVLRVIEYSPVDQETMARIYEDAAELMRTAVTDALDDLIREQIRNEEEEEDEEDDDDDDGSDGGGAAGAEGADSTPTAQVNVVPEENDPVYPEEEEPDVEPEEDDPTDTRDIDDEREASSLRVPNPYP